jgi:hypothetical protein
MAMSILEQSEDFLNLLKQIENLNEPLTLKEIELFIEIRCTLEELDLA